MSLGGERKGYLSLKKKQARSFCISTSFGQGAGEGGREEGFVQRQRDMT